MNKTLLGCPKDSCGYGNLYTCCASLVHFLPSLTLCRSLKHVHLCFHIIMDPELYEKSVMLFYNILCTCWEPLIAVNKHHYTYML